MMIGYRRDIDGLRSLAILPVLMFHARVPGFTGGFVGVDIFFVISGFLITAIIVREMDAGEFSLLRFYERRARRILPALLAMIAAVLALASWLYLPGDFEQVPRSALMALGFMSNVWFFLNTGYFQAAAEGAPLLHCWSLGVEEQFYIGLPLLLWLIARFMPLWRSLVIVAIAAISFALAVLTTHAGDGFAFYLLPPRAWELLVGSLLAVGPIPTIRRTALREVLAVLGVCLIGLAVFGYDRFTPFPGLTAIAPVLGSALLLHSAPGTLVGRCLSHRLPVGIGLISYSLYLWHWPFVVFTEYVSDARLNGWWSLAVIAASLLAAWLSWRFIERPFRDGQRFARRKIFAFSGVGIAVLALICASMLPLAGWDSRFSRQVNQLVAARQDFSPMRADCINLDIGGERPACTYGASVPPTSLVWGDSHGVELAWALGEAEGRKGNSVMQRSRASCLPLQNYAPANDPECAQFNLEVLDRIAKTPTLRRVYLVGFWAGEDDQAQAKIDKFDATVARIRALGKSVTIVGPLPRQKFYVPRYLAHRAQSGSLDSARGTSAADYARDTTWFTRNYPRWRAAGITVLDPAQALMDGDATRIVAQGIPLYFDSHHLSLAGARAVVAIDPSK